MRRELHKILGKDVKRSIVGLPYELTELRCVNFDNNNESLLLVSAGYVVGGFDLGLENVVKCRRYINSSERYC